MSSRRDGVIARRQSTRKRKTVENKSVDSGKHILEEVPNRKRKVHSKKTKSGDERLVQKDGINEEKIQNRHDDDSKVDDFNTLEEIENRGVNRCRDFDIVFNSRSCEPKIDVSKRFGLGSGNIAHFLYNMTVGVPSSKKLLKSVTRPLVSMLSELQLYRTASPFDRRVTAMEWHPTNPNIIAVGSKSGDLIMWNIEAAKEDLFIQGSGAGGSIQAMKFWPTDDRLVLTASVDGRVVIQDFEGRKSMILSDIMNSPESWYSCVDVSVNSKVVLTGDNVGNTLLLSEQGEKLWSHRLHKGKVSHVEWSPREEWLFCTGSSDQTVKLWDSRMIAGKESALKILHHQKPVNSAYFSLTDGCRLLTTDQNHEIRVYSAPQWQLEKTILHPHRFFQHITPFKAHWHPLQDLIVVGRYPDDKFLEGDTRTIDVYDAGTGKMACQLHDPSANGLCPLNRFNPRGDCLASGMGYNILIWSRKEEIMQKQEAIMADLRKQGLGSNSTGGMQPTRRPRGQGRQNSKEAKSKTTKDKNSKSTDTKLKAKLKEQKSRK